VEAEGREAAGAFKAEDDRRPWTGRTGWGCVGHRGFRRRWWTRSREVRAGVGMAAMWGPRPADTWAREVEGSANGGAARGAASPGFQDSSTMPVGT
jgi:hypothetical protein